VLDLDSVAYVVCWTRRLNHFFEHSASWEVIQRRYEFEAAWETPEFDPAVAMRYLGRLRDLGGGFPPNGVLSVGVFDAP
jgi:hypothetical protein